MTGRVRGRFSRRRWNRRWVASRWWVLTLVVLAVVAFGVWVVAFSTWLGVHRVTVSGAPRIPDGKVRAAAAVPEGTPLARVDVDAVRSRVEQIPAVASASVHRGWPQTLTIKVTRRQAVATIHRGGAWRVVDKHGVAFRTTDAPVPGLPKIQLRPHARAETIQAVAHVAEALPTGLARRVQQITAQTMDSITLHLSDHRTVLWGGPARSQRKAEVLTVLLQRKAARYDVSVPEMPTTRGAQAAGE